MTNSKKVFLTSSVMFAFVDRNDPKHQQASAYLRCLAQGKYNLYITLSSITKTYNDLRKHMSYSIAKDFIRAMFVGNIEIVYPDEAATKAALKLILSETQRDFNNFEHALTNVLADRNQIPQICSFEFSRFYFGISLFTLPI
jgi:predicted nucleic acid-binding protein